ncbi:hypothetical protein ACHQM5_025979 [Ranunculus cassubicifolius]
MLLSKPILDAFGVLTICLVCVLVLLGLFATYHTIHFCNGVRKQGYVQLDCFNKPWITRITFIFFAICSVAGEITRLTFLRHKQTVCKFYLVSNLGLAEPCFLLTFLFLLRASVKKSRELGADWKTICYIFLFSVPSLIIQLLVVLMGGRLPSKIHAWKVPHYFTTVVAPVVHGGVTSVQCTYPLLSIIFFGMYAVVVTLYSLWLERQMVCLVINKKLRKRVFFLIFVSSLIPIRVTFLGLSILSHPGKLVFEALVFTSFVVLLCCSGLSISMLVLYPVSDSLALMRLWDFEAESSNIQNNREAKDELNAA